MDKGNDENKITIKEYDNPLPDLTKANKILTEKETIPNYLLFIANENKVQQHLRIIKCIVQTDWQESLKHTTINDYFLSLR